MTTTAKSVLATGTNRRIGQALVEEACRGGTKKVYSGARRPLLERGMRGTPLLRDMTNAAQIQQAVEQGNREILGSTR